MLQAIKNYVEVFKNGYAEISLMVGVFGEYHRWMPKLIHPTERALFNRKRYLSGNDIYQEKEQGR